MTAFTILAKLAGLSHREAGEFLGVRIDTVKSWSSGRNPCKDEVLKEISALIAQQERAARETLARIAAEKPDRVELGFPRDDAEARAMGWPCAAAWGAFAARVIAGSPSLVSIVPRGSTPATRAARGAREP